MTDVLVISDTPGWCFAQRAGALKRYAPPDIRFTTLTGCADRLWSVPFAKYDVVLTLRPDLAGEIRRLLRGSRVPLLGCYNSGIGRAGHSLPETMAACDYVIVNNYAAWSEWRDRCRIFNAGNVSNGVDLGLFYPAVPIRERPNRVLWTASREKAECEEDIKGYRRIVRPLDRVLPAKGIECDVRVAEGCGMPSDAMREWYNSGSVYVVTSSSEGTPNVLLEAMACGCAVVCSDVGNVPEIVEHGRSGLIVRDRQTIPFIEAIKEAIHHKDALSAGALDAVRSWGWKFRVGYYYAVIRRLARGWIPRPFTYLETDPGGV